MTHRPRTFLGSAFALTLGAATIAFVPVGSALAAAEKVRAEGPLNSYNAALVPAGATARVQAIATASDATVVVLKVRGLVPNRAYGAHVHVHACGATGSVAGPHYRNEGTAAGATDPAYANPDNEIWLDLVTDSEGNGSAQSRVRWLIREGGAGSVVLHDHHTSTAEGSAGTAGPRLGCLSVPF